MSPPPRPQLGFSPPQMRSQARALSGATPEPPPPPMPAPTHDQTVTALRHFQAILSELRTLLKNPELGRSDVKSDIIDLMTRLVANRMVPATSAVEQLSKVPDRPYDQKKAVEWMYDQTMQARDAIVSHHALAFAGAPPQEAPDANDHMKHVAAMMEAHYSAGVPNG
jgi:hypothetical protein